MPKRTLNIVESAYRVVLEEQDDTIAWLLAAIRSPATVTGGAAMVELSTPPAVESAHPKIPISKKE